MVTKCSYLPTILYGIFLAKTPFEPSNIYNTLHFSSNFFFLYDVVRQRLHVLVKGEYILLLRRYGKLKSQILSERTVKLQLFLLPYIIQATSLQMYNRVDISLGDNFNKVGLWIQYFTDYRLDLTMECTILRLLPS
ncbi:hypothetical protein BDF21DRAFT_397917 [Thamnidium elegans]|nr:hypothetical protein BDF21DRAFT_397917 [Thamnidium elegans]